MHYRNGRVDGGALFPRVYDDLKGVVRDTRRRARQFEGPWDIKKAGENHTFGRKNPLDDAIERLKVRLEVNAEDGDRDSFFLRSTAAGVTFIIREVEVTGDLEVVPREDWGAEEPRSRSPLALPTPEVFIHHTVTESENDLEGQKERMRRLQADAKAEDYADIEYNFVVFQNGTVFEGRGFGTTSGATVNTFFNSRSHSFCAAGNFEVMEPSSALTSSLQALNRKSRELGFVAPDAPTRAHRDVKATACPGAKLFARLRSLS